MSRALSGCTRLLAAVAALILAIGVLQPGAVSAATTITLMPASGPAGTTVNVTGSGFTPGDTVTITFSGFGTVQTAPVNGSGSIATNFNVPSGASTGYYTVTATDMHSHTGTAQFQVTSGSQTTLSISKSVSNPSSGILTYQINYQNTGTVTATGVAITDQLQQGQTLIVSSLPAGCTYSTTSSGTTVTCVPNSTGTPGNVPRSGTSGSSGSFSFSTSISHAFSGTIYNTAVITANNAATQTSNTTAVTVNGGGGNPGPTSLQKTVEDNNSGYFATTINANPGDVITYDIAYINGSTTTAYGVNITDALQPGQTYIGPPYSSSSCVPAGGNTISCAAGNVAPNTRVDVFISASINSNVPGTAIPNQAQATTGGTTITSNTTTVYVYGPQCTSGYNCCTTTNQYGCCTSANQYGCCTTTNQYGCCTTANQYGCCTTTNQYGCCNSGYPNTCCPSGNPSACCPSGNPNACCSGSPYTSCCASANNNGCCLNTNTTCCYNGTANNCCFYGNNYCCANGTYNTCCQNGGYNGCCVNGFFNSCATGNFILCGPVTAYNGSSVTVDGITVPIVPGAAGSGTVEPGTNECITFALNSSGQATALAVSSNLAAVGVACGFYGGTSASGVLSVSGIGIPLAANATFQSFLTPSGFYCFLLNGSGQAYAVLSGVPTSLQRAVAGGGATQVAREKFL